MADKQEQAPLQKMTNVTNKYPPYLLIAYSKSELLKLSILDFYVTHIQDSMTY